MSDMDTIRAQVDAVFNHAKDPEDNKRERQAMVDEYTRMFGDRDSVDVERWLDAYYETTPLNNFILHCERERLQAVVEAARAILAVTGLPSAQFDEQISMAEINLRGALAAYERTGKG